MVELNPKFTLLNAKLRANSNQGVKLYALANSLDPIILHFLHQQESLEKDMSKSRIGIAKDRRIWDDLQQKIEQAKHN